MGHQEGAGEVRRCTHQGGDQIQLGIPEFDFESNSGSRTTLASNCYTRCIRNWIWTVYICSERGRDKISNGMGPRSN
jgi:hypothetical protein